MASVDKLKKIFKGKGSVKNHSSKTIWVVESTTNDPHGPAIAHQLSPHRKSPQNIDADGFKRVDGIPIHGHSSWWKLYDCTTADVHDHGDSLSVSISIVQSVSEKSDW